MVQCFHIEDGHVSWRNRWVRSEKYKVERAAGESLFGVFNNPMTADPSVAEVEYLPGSTGRLSPPRRFALSGRSALGL